VFIDFELYICMCVSQRRQDDPPGGADGRGGRGGVGGQDPGQGDSAYYIYIYIYICIYGEVVSVDRTQAKVTGERGSDR
jgi:hypothetical protein